MPALNHRPETPVRRVIALNRLGRGPRWEFDSPKLRVRLAGSGTLLFDYYVRIEANPDVVGPYHPGMPVQMNLNGKLCSSELDALVTLADGRQRVERVAYADTLEFPSVANDIQIQRGWATENGSAYESVTEEQIRGNGQHLKNCHEIVPWLREMHDQSDAVMFAVSGAITSTAEPLMIETISEKTKLPIDAVVPAVLRGFVKGQFLLPEFKTRQFGRQMLVVSRLHTNALPPG